MSGIRIAQIGVGHWGKNLARNFAQMGNLAAVADFDASTATTIAAEHGSVVRDVGEILADPLIHGIALATPAATHAQFALCAIEAGKHVFVEKPLALDPADAKRVISAAERSGRILMVGHLLQYHPIFIRLREIVAAGELGKISYVYSNRLSLGKFRAEEDVLWSFAPHDISMILALTGETPKAVDANGAAFVTPGIADCCIAHLTFPSGVRAHVQVSWAHPYKEHRLVVIGETGMAVFEDSQPEWTKRLAVYRHGIDRNGPTPVPVRAEPEFVEVASGEPLRLECQHFVDCIANGRHPWTDGREGLEVLDVLHRASAGLAASLKAAER